MIPMELREIQIQIGNDPFESPVVVLCEREGTRTLPIFIGHREAWALDSAVHGEISIRPMTHDLLINAIEDLGASLEEIQVDALRDNTFFGKLVLRTASGSEVRVDSRPSDALVLAMKKGVPVYVDDSVLSEVNPPSPDEEPEI
ncbi:bifunctional nuclease family protein [Candidatus Sumerlaeota bacterium]|nr:bifunctional nuclease family protein [Candidatus Sumerlaeota bacterium]